MLARLLWNSKLKLERVAHVGFEVKGIIKTLNHSVVTRLRLWFHSNRAIY